MAAITSASHLESERISIPKRKPRQTRPIVEPLGQREARTGDFPEDAPGSKGQHADVLILAGLICLNGRLGMDLDLHLEMFAAVLDELDTMMSA